MVESVASDETCEGSCDFVLSCFAFANSFPSSALLRCGDLRRTIIAAAMTATTTAPPMPPAIPITVVVFITGPPEFGDG